MNEFISENIQDNILRVTLNNPSTQNTLSLDMIRRLQTVFENADKNHDIKIIILASSGKIFCAGHNLKEINNHRSDPDKGLSFFTILINSCSELMLTILHNSKPVIAEVNGVATATVCALMGLECTVFMGEKTSEGTSTKRVFHRAIAPFHKPGFSTN